MDRRHDRQRQQPTEPAHHDERQRGAKHDPDDRADQCDGEHLGDEDCKDGGVGGAKGLQRRDDLAPPVEVCLHRIDDADAADQQRREPNQGQELGEAFDGPFELRGCVGAAADLPARLG